MDELSPDLRRTSHEQANSEESFQQLDSHYVNCEWIAGWISLVVVIVLAGCVSLGFWLFRGFDWVTILVGIAALTLSFFLAIASFVWPRLHYRHASWKLDEESLEIRQGVFWKHRISVPLGRVQHADVSQGPIQRRYQLGKLIVHTAGTYQASVELDGLNHGVAVQLRDRLIKQTQHLSDN